MSLLHRFAEVLEVVGQSLLLLVDVELLDVVNHLLLQAVLVVLHLRDRLQSLYDALANLLGPALLIRLDTLQEVRYVIELFRELVLQGSPFLTAELRQLLQRTANGFEGGLPFLFAQGVLRVARHYLGHAQQGTADVVGGGDAVLLRFQHLAQILLHEGHVEHRTFADAFLLEPQGALHLAAHKGAADEGAHLHLALAVERGHSGGQVEGFGVERLDFAGDFFVQKLYGLFAVAGHREYHACVCFGTKLRKKSHIVREIFRKKRDNRD